MTSSVYKKMGQYTEAVEEKRLWHTLSTHEEHHAAALKRIKQTLNEKELEEEASALDIENVETMLSKNLEFLAEIPQGLSTKRAFEIAMFMEFSELNSLFFNAAEKKEEDPSPYIHSLGEGTKHHLLTLYKVMQKHISKDEDAKYREKFEKIGLIDKI